MTALVEKYGKPSFILQNGDLTLRRWQLSDADELYNMIIASYSELKPWMLWITEEHTLNHTLRYLQFTIAQWEQGNIFDYAIIVDNRICGAIGVKSPLQGDIGVGVGYWLATSVTGRGLATRAVTLLKETSFGLGVELMQIWHHKDNYKSRRIPDRLGFNYIGIRHVPGEDGEFCLWEIQHRD